MTGQSRRCIRCGEDISDRGRAAKRCKECANSIRQQRSIGHQERRAEQKAISGGTVTRAHINSLLQKQKNSCPECGIRFWGREARQATIDHDIPLIRGGAHDDSNIKRMLCRSCNSSKGAKSFAEWKAQVRLIKPERAPSLSTQEIRTRSHFTVRFPHPDNVSNVRMAADQAGLSPNAWVVNILTDAAERLHKLRRADRGIISTDYLPPLDCDEEYAAFKFHDETQWDRETGAL